MAYQTKTLAENPAEVQRMEQRAEIEVDRLIFRGKLTAKAFKSIMRFLIANGIEGYHPVGSLGGMRYTWQVNRRVYTFEYNEHGKIGKLEIAELPDYLR